MAIFSMCIGLPAAGKSTWAQNHSNIYTIISSDAIRKELYGDESVQIDHARVFAIAHERILAALQKPADVIFDATNLTMKNRRTILEKVRKLPHTLITAEVFAESFPVLLERNATRERKVPEHAIGRMMKQFEMPTHAEGFDYINIHNEVRISANYLLELAKDFDQDNPHHSLSLYNHCKKASDFLTGKPVMYTELRAAAMYHDLGKLFTKTYLNARGEPSDHAHYYGHENVGAYLALTYKELHDTCLDIVEVAQLINYHMKPYSEFTEKAKERHRRRLGSNLYEKVMILHEADVAAH